MQFITHIEPESGYTAKEMSNLCQPLQCFFFKSSTSLQKDLNKPTQLRYSSGIAKTGSFAAISDKTI